MQKSTHPHSLCGRVSPLFVVSADVVGVARFEQCLESKGGGEEGVSEDESKGGWGDGDIVRLPFFNVGAHLCC